ncbi:hypothetical protein [Amycolatopsis sp. RTGN1]|uniref:hypothetical protein n=1 Tax=Amycolatopsis ponsaeliensis TaxID=2992142 RepID=UPI00254CB343|nr:hypothetical protein [Amycolatopsis sp. RTGN1]
MRRFRDETHPLLATLTSFSHLDDDPACVPRSSSPAAVRHEVRAVPVIAESPSRAADDDQNGNR